MHEEGVAKLLQFITGVMNEAVIKSADKMFNIVMNEFFLPELERRRNEGKTPTSLDEVWAGQLIIYPETIIRFNDETRINIISPKIKQRKYDEITSDEVEQTFTHIESLKKLAGARDEAGMSQLIFIKSGQQIHWQFPDLFQLIKSTVIRLNIARVCDECGRIFEPDIRNIKRQRFCSRTCQNRNAQRTYRTKKSHAHS